MDIKTKLKYIQEGYTFSDIISSDFNPINNIQTLREVDEIFIESFTNDIQYIMEMSSESQSKLTFFDHLKKILKWLKDKIIQFVKFIKQKLFKTTKDSKKTVNEIKANAQKAESSNKEVILIKREEKKQEPKKTHQLEPHQDPKPEYEELDQYEEPQYDDDYDDYEYRNSDGSLEYRPEENDITLFSKILTHDNFFDIGFRKVYNIISKYVDQLERHPENNENIINSNDLLNTKPFLNKIFKEALSVDYNKIEIFKKVYGDVITKPITVKELMVLANKLEKLDDECQVFADWIQKTLPDSLEKVEESFKTHINRARNSDDPDKKLIQNLNDSLNKIIKLIGIEMTIIQVFATMHAEVFTHVRAEVQQYDWVFNPMHNDAGYDDVYH